MPGSRKAGLMGKQRKVGWFQRPTGLQLGDIKGAEWIWMLMLQFVNHSCYLLLWSLLVLHAHTQKKKRSNPSLIRQEGWGEVGCFAHVKPTKLLLTMGMINIYTCPGKNAEVYAWESGLKGLKVSGALTQESSETITAALLWSGTVMFVGMLTGVC